MKKEFALDPGGPKRLTITYTAQLADIKVLLDGQQIMSFATKADFLRGTTVKAPDGSLFTVRFATIAGLVFFKGIHVIRNGAPVPGTAADPVPQWAWIFIGLSILIPVLSLGGAIPALLGTAGVAATLMISRLRHWSTALRVALSAAVTGACWICFLLLAVALTALKGGVSANATNRPATKAAPARSTTDQLIHDIGVTYYKHGHLQSEIDKMKEDLYDRCDAMQSSQCVDMLRKALVEARNSPNIN